MSHIPTVAFLGNPNVGKSSLFNRLTGLCRHTGNWSGKTVDSAIAKCKIKDCNLNLVDLPGTYSLTPKSFEEEVSEEFLIFNQPEITVVVADATCLMRNMILLMETLEVTKNVVLCINLMDEAKKQKIKINTEKLSEILNIPVVVVSARKRNGIEDLVRILKNPPKCDNTYLPRYTKPIEDAIAELVPYLNNSINLSPRWLSIRILSGDYGLFEKILSEKGVDFLKIVGSQLETVKKDLKEKGITTEKFCDITASCRVLCAEEIADACITREGEEYRHIDRILDKIFTGKITSTVTELLLLAFIFWLTLFGANKISGVLSLIFSQLEEEIFHFLSGINTPDYILLPLCHGILHILFKVISVMMPPMAIFFPLFTLLEDLGYLPRLAFNLDKHFKKCNSCGKQAYTMCMGFGCNAAGVAGARIIDSKRERLLAILTNCLVPCNGKFPALTSIITMFLIFTASEKMSTFYGAVVLTLFILLSIAVTFLTTNVLSKTLLCGEASSFTLELPPYRKPEFFKILVRSFLDRGIFVISRAAVVATPCGLVVWLMANVTFDGQTLLAHASEFLEPIASLMGLDGTILLAFILGFPANEIVIPLIITGYSALSTIAPDGGLMEIRELFLQNGWTVVTALNVIIFMLFHWPCSTTLLTVKKETESIKLTFLAFIIPTVIGFSLCVCINFISKIFI